MVGQTFRDKRCGAATNAPTLAIGIEVDLLTGGPDKSYEFGPAGAAFCRSPYFDKGLAGTQ